MPLKVSVETRKVRVMSSELQSTPTSSTISFSEDAQVSGDCGDIKQICIADIML